VPHRPPIDTEKRRRRDEFLPIFARNRALRGPETRHTCARGRPPRGGGARRHDDRHTHDYVRPVYTPRPHWAKSADNGQRAGPARIVASGRKGLKQSARRNCSDGHRDRRPYANEGCQRVESQGLR
jgi:hypothetical protein